MLLVAILNFILIFICELLGAACIATAIKYLKKKKKTTLDSDSVLWHVFLLFFLWQRLCFVEKKEGGERR